MHFYHDRIAFVRANTRPVAVAGLEPLRLYLADELTPIWEATEADFGARKLAPPFWAFAWAGGQGLARHVMAHPETVRGKCVLDIACGSGIVGIAAVLAGASHVLVNDLDPMCEAAAALNAELNGVKLGWRGGDLLDNPPMGVDVILAGDTFYEKPMADRFIAFLMRMKGAGAAVFAADPGRAYAPVGLALRGKYEVSTSLAIENAESKTVKVWEV
ncbi:MAG: 50S ribosomal protein L11 methyltransferase [Alphaproteobacteria bacterium]|nr:50S ribosomal protein L11 methyltransferase [Alphaproteobacteria bacterium]